MSDETFVDTHIHFWDRPHDRLVWNWLDEDYVHPVLGDTSAIKELQRYSVEEYLKDIHGVGVTKAVHVQAAIGSPDPVEETIWLESIRQRAGWPSAIVGSARLQSYNVEDTLERHVSGSPFFRGVRDFAQGDYLVDEAFQSGYALLEKYRLVCDLDVTWENMGKAASLAQMFPTTTLIIDHTGFPQSTDHQYFSDWRRGIKKFKEVENAVVKISGLGMSYQASGSRWTTERIRPWIEASIEAFGTRRSFFGTNWPVDSMYSDYPTLIRAYREIISSYSPHERRALLAENAERVYRI